MPGLYTSPRSYIDDQGQYNPAYNPGFGQYLDTSVPYGPLNTNLGHRGRQQATGTAPYGTYRSSSGPNGTTESYSMNRMPLSQPQQGPQMSPDHVLWRQGAGLDSRGNSPGFAQQQYAQQQRVAPQMPYVGGQQQPINPGANTAQINAQSRQQVAQMHQQGQTQAQQNTLAGRYSSDINTAAKAIYAQHPEKGWDAAMAEAKTGHPMAWSPATQPSVQPSAPYSAPQPQQQQPAPGVPYGPAEVARPYQNPISGNMQAGMPITAQESQRRLDMAHADPTVQQHIREMYATAGADLRANPTLGTTAEPLPANRMQTTYSPEAARRAVEMGPTQMTRNEGAIRRGYEANRMGVVQNNADQFAQNQRGQQNVDARLQQFDQGNYDLSQPAQPQQAQPQPQQATNVPRGQLRMSGPAGEEMPSQGRYSEADIQHTMQLRGITREQVLAVLQQRGG